MEYELKQTEKSGGFVVRVYCPIISQEERSKRMKAIHKAAEALLKEANKK